MHDKGIHWTGWEGAGFARGQERAGSLWFGVAIAVLGVTLLLDNLDVIQSSREILRFWPVILIGAGIHDLFAARGRGRAMGGTVLAAVGVLFLLNSFGTMDFRIWELWPLFLILFGVQVLIGSDEVPAPVEEVVAETDDGQFDTFSFVGGARREVTGTFKGGKITTFVGGTNIDLRHAEMEGSRAVVDVFSVIGGIEIRIPDDWKVETEVSAIAGAVDDRTRPLGDASKTLVIAGTVIVGGVEIKN